MIRRPPRSTLSSSSAASDVYKRQVSTQSTGASSNGNMPDTHTRSEVQEYLKAQNLEPMIQDCLTACVNQKELPKSGVEFMAKYFAEQCGLKFAEEGATSSAAVEAVEAVSFVGSTPMPEGVSSHPENEQGKVSALYYAESQQTYSYLCAVRK
eukprot:TRINITY_DN11199_c0_g1_i4.p1 TRINITY_DN11199_c0_g1~~TRINITY_DN11199_c0_g1_i4.p1  ORF type:complete len:153 (-),score=38.25 TRINITY_DN11199_c0_g1_i4:195-653(-)